MSPKPDEQRVAIPVHHTGTSSAAWDGPGNVARLKLDQDAAYYELAYAWRDSAADQSKKNAYKFIHHEVDSKGAIGAANIQACRMGIAVLNGGRGGTKIPGHDRPGVYAHLAAHLRDAKLEPPPLRSDAAQGELERRAFGPCEFRVATDGKSIEGHAAVFKSAADLGLFHEQVAPGAFTKSIKESDIRALFNHDPNFVLGRNKSGTLDLSEDSKGLLYRVMPPDTQWARDLMESMKRGDVNQSSFGFRTVKDDWEQASADAPILRTLQEVRLFDVSPVTFPAYQDTDCAARSLLDGAAGRDLGTALCKLRTGEDLTVEELDLVRTHVGGLEERLRTTQPEPLHTEPEHETARHSNDLLLRRLTIAEQEL